MVMNEGMASRFIAKLPRLELTMYWSARCLTIDQVMEYPNSYPYLGGLLFSATQNACNADVTHKEKLLGSSS